MEAIALFDRAQSYATQIRSGLGRSFNTSSDADSFNVTEKELQDMESKIRGRKCQVHAAWYLIHGEDGENLDNKMSSMSLDENTLDEVRSVDYSWGSVVTCNAMTILTFLVIVCCTVLACFDQASGHIPNLDYLQEQPHGAPFGGLSSCPSAYPRKAFVL